MSQFKQLLPATATPSKLLIGKVPIKLKLKNYWGYKTLDDLIKLVNKFGVSGCAFHLSKVEDGCCTCIAVIWLYSTTEVKQLKMVLSEIAGSLQTMGVLQVFIGEEELVLECSHSTPTGNHDKPHAVCLFSVTMIQLCSSEGHTTNHAVKSPFTLCYLPS